MNNYCTPSALAVPWDALLADAPSPGPAMLRATTFTFTTEGREWRRTLGHIERGRYVPDPVLSQPTPFHAAMVLVLQMHNATAHQVVAVKHLKTNSQGSTYAVAWDDSKPKDQEWQVTT